jgi:hypothetical protein
MIPYLVLTWVLGSLVIALLGKGFRFGFWGYFFGSLLFTPLIGLLFLAAAIPPRHRRP